MDLISIILLAVGLAMDCFAISIAQGLATDIHDHLHRPKPALMALLFGVFQGGMPLISYYAGGLFCDFFHTFAPWIALILLGFIGGKMIWESQQKREQTSQTAEWGIGRLLLLAVATSIDALATGVILIPYPESLWTAVMVIGLTSMLLSVAGYLIGMFAGERFHMNATLIGGLILVAIGLKIWIEGVCLS
ncbi:MAG: manganese efflux pump [Paludibacteraceae bacterium]|nr:manganese efflux pump [Paludibacteraceae bacterium]